MTYIRRFVRCSSRGFSLVELMAVVTITGILACMAVMAFTRHLAASRGAEAVAIMQTIRSAEEAYKAENHIYLNVSTDSGGNQWYPVAVPGTDRHLWSKGTADLARWRALAPPVNQLVMFSYLVNAGVPGSKLPVLDLSKGPDFSAAQPLDWYVIQARGDTNGNNVFAKYASTSMTGEIYVENEGE